MGAVAAGWMRRAANRLHLHASVAMDNEPVALDSP